MKLVLYQTLKDKGNPDEVERNGPFMCKRSDAWLGHGYYFWDGHIELGHFWGAGDDFRKGYIICSADANLDNFCWDLHGNALHRIEFEHIANFLVESKITTEDKITVAQVIEYLKSKGQFKYLSIRVLGMNTISNKYHDKVYVKRMTFVKNNFQYFDIYPPVQFCLIIKNALSLRNFLIVYPKEYVNDIYA